ncbi:MULTISPECIES: MerR family transcriptional regulator [unclassified Streptomyces]|uniref:MerR family transcriptional regulator n=1 Tax=unclassified Streptomyces TaxID=2593676 RepID=UPI002251497F|nr:MULTISPECIES: MerR family transcriptional regulator [unclassified Streptomyces]MCX5087722.1 MerR family transcriptional regulator [Streptomyces sp. NBC_00365]MCX5181727.1 MerR family transcriptional regulator [Streptomyces sp. NBC_00268]
MDGGILYSIGELAQRTGLTVKTVRFYSDRGIVAPADRTHAGYRRYAPDAVARLALVRTLRELGVGLDTIRRVVDQELSLSEVAAEHAAALDVQISILRLRRAVLTAAAEREPTPKEMELMHQLATLSEAERRSLIDDFLDSVFEGLGSGSHHAAARRSMTPELPDNPTDDQVRAWVELAELSLDPDFRASLRRLTEDHVADLPDGTPTPPRPDMVAVARDLVRPAMTCGISPDSPQADPVVAALTAHCALAHGRPDDADLHRWLLRRLEAASDPDRDEYLRLLALINDWPVPERLAPAMDWSVTALRIRAA